MKVWNKTPLILPDEIHAFTDTDLKSKLSVESQTHGTEWQIDLKLSNLWPISLFMALYCDTI